MLVDDDPRLTGAKMDLYKLAVKQAKRDPRSKGFRFPIGKFSLVVSYGKVAEQIKHIDVGKSEMQFAMILTDGVPGTVFHDAVEGRGPCTPNHLIELLSRQSSDADCSKDLSPALSNALRQNEDVEYLMNNFGTVLSPSFNMRKPEGDNCDLKTGTVLSLPGGVVHAGPESSTYRLILFFSAQREDQDQSTNQYVGPILIAEIVMLVWKEQGITCKERQFLFRSLAHYIEDYAMKSSTKFSKNISHASNKFYTFYKSIEDNPCMKRLEKKRLVKKYAKPDLFDTESLQSTDFIRVGLGCAPEQASAEDIAICFDNIFCRVVLYFHPASLSTAGQRNVALHFIGHPNDLTWKGTPKTGDLYTLSMDHEGVLFDCANGELKGPDGNTVCCGRIDKNVNFVPVPET